MVGIFRLVCPDCGREIRGVDAEHWVCADCDRTYLLGVGHLIPVTCSDVRGGESSAIDLTTADA